MPSGLFLLQEARRRALACSLGRKFFHLFASIDPNSAEVSVSTTQAIDASFEGFALHVFAQVYLQLYSDSSIGSRCIIFESQLDAIVVKHGNPCQHYLLLPSLCRPDDPHQERPSHRRKNSSIGAVHGAIRSNERSFNPFAGG